MHLSKEEVAKLVGQKIRQIRLKKRLTIEEAAHNAGLEYTQLSRIELGKINTSIYHVFMISETLEVRVHEVFKEVYKSDKNNNSNNHSRKVKVELSNNGNHKKSKS